jgi:CCR4-NOT transcription complex subunit 7/8
LHSNEAYANLSP